MLLTEGMFRSMQKGFQFYHAHNYAHYSDKIPRLPVKRPTTSLNEVKNTAAITDVKAIRFL